MWRPPYEGPTYEDEQSAAAADPPPPPLVATSLPTWRNFYDWPNGHGYVGWHSSSSRTGAYGIEQNLGGKAGLWLWPAGEQDYTASDFAEWTYTAPGTTRIAKVDLSFAYRNKLLAHHCLVVGLRSTTGVVAQNEWCQPAQPPDSQREVPVTLVDPSSNPTSTTLFVRIRVDCKNATSCSKHVPALDPLVNAGTAQLKLVDMTLVDDDAPQIEVVDERLDISAERYEIAVEATDAGSGISSLRVDHVDAGVVGETAAVCDPTHRTPDLDNRICPATLVMTRAIDTSLMSEGTHGFQATAIDVAANRGTFSWSITIDRTPAVVVHEDEVLFDPPVPASEALAWAPDANLTAVQFLTTFAKETDPFTVGHPVEPGLTPEEAVAEHALAVESMFDDLAEAGVDRRSAYPGYALVDRMVVRGTQESLATAAADSRIALASDAPTPSRSIAATAACGQSPWWPQSGTIATRTSTSPKWRGRRFVFQSFKWTTTNLANLQCPDDVTYEAESIYDNYDGRTFLGGKVDWSSNMPKDYFDTNFLDKANELNIAVGTSDARLLRPNVVYWTLVRTRLGNASTDRGKVQGQRGDRLPSICHRPACIFPDATARLLPAWRHSVPGFSEWTGGTAVG